MKKLMLLIFRFRLLFRKGWCTKHLSRYTSYSDPRTFKLKEGCRLCKDEADAKKNRLKERKYWVSEALEDEARKFRADLGIVPHQEPALWPDQEQNFGGGVLAQNPFNYAPFIQGANYGEQEARAMADEAIDNVLGDDMR